MDSVFRFRRKPYGPVLARIAAVCSVLALTASSAMASPPEESLARPKSPPPTRVVAPGAPSEPSVPPAAHGDWGQWRGNPQHTGFQGLPGRIQSPSIRWRYRLGGRVKPEQALLCSAPGLADQLLVAPSGQLAAYTLDGTPVWQRRMSFDLVLLGCWDLAANGHTQILAASAANSGGQLYAFDSGNGALLWTSPQTPGQVGAVKVVQLDQTPALELLWLPASSSTVQAYTFASGPTQPTLLWSSEIANFISDPYTFSSLGVAVLGSGGRRVVVSGGRHQIPLIVLDAATGSEVERRTYPEAQAMESGGYGQLLQLKPVDETGRIQVIAIADYSSAQQYMFQGVTRTSLDDTSIMQMLDTRPVGLHYARGSVGAFDPDAADEILVSRYDPTVGRHDLLLLSAVDLTVKARLANFYLEAIADLGDGQGPFVIGRPGVTAESPSGTEPLVAVRYAGSEFRQTAWLPGTARLARLLPRSCDDPVVDNPGASAIVLRSGGSASVLVQRVSRFTGRYDVLDAADVASGASVGRYAARPGVNLTVLAVRSGATAAQTRVIAAGDDGLLVFLDGSLSPIASVPVGGYYRNQAANAHAFEVAAIADLNGSGQKQILAIDSADRVLKLEGVSGEAAPSGSVFWETGGLQELFVLPWSRGGSRVLVQSPGYGTWMLNLLDGSGAPIWMQPLPPGDGIPIGFNFGRLQNSAQRDIVFSCGSNASFPRPTCAWDATTGAQLWRSPVGTYWDGTLAMWDFDGDGFDDVVSNFNIYKGAVISGRTGQSLAEPVSLPMYGDLESVDYNGAPMVVGRDRAGIEVINAEDDAHLARIAIGPGAPSGVPLAGAAVWADPQARPDDQRYSMPAAAPDGRGQWMLGVGSQSGVLSAVAADGSLLWSVRLWNGQVVEDQAGGANSLSSVLALDVAGSGRPAFVVGGSDGWLYAVDALTGILVWSLDLGAPVGEPIAGDIENRGSSDIVVPAADGYLYAIGQSAK